VKQVIDTYLYDQRVPLANDIAGTLKVKPKLLARKKIVPRVLDKIVGFVDKFFER
jgi:type I restriction enzyme R subunit